MINPLHLRVFAMDHVFATLGLQTWLCPPGFANLALPNSMP
jgi:hypothetical protein